MRMTESIFQKFPIDCSKPPMVCKFQNCMYLTLSSRNSSRNCTALDIYGLGLHRTIIFGYWLLLAAISCLLASISCQCDIIITLLAANSPRYKLVPLTVQTCTVDGTNLYYGELAARSVIMTSHWQLIAANRQLIAANSG